jgi:hypothetical protein
MSIGDAESDLDFLIEVDMGTESPSHVAKHIVRWFERMHAADAEVEGVHPFGLLILTTSERRIRSLARAVKNTGAPIYLQVFDVGAPPPLLTAPWLWLGNPQLAPQLVVTLEPHDTG